MVGGELLQSALGLPPGAVRLDAHQSVWEDAFVREAAILRGTVGNLFCSLEHIGSTCIPNIRAKPTIDMAAAIPSFDLIPSLSPRLDLLGYEHLGDGIVEGHHVFAKGEYRTHLLHVVERDGRRWRELIAFRDFLMGSPRVAAEYEAFKVELAQRFAGDRRAYREAKAPFIDPIVASLMQDS